MSRLKKQVLCDLITRARVDHLPEAFICLTPMVESKSQDAVFVAQVSVTVSEERKQKKHNPILWGRFFLLTSAAI